MSAEQQLDLAESEINYGIAALVLTRDYVPGYDIAEGLRLLDVIADRVRSLLAEQPDGDEPGVRIAAINTCHASPAARSRPKSDATSR